MTLAKLLKMFCKLLPILLNNHKEINCNSRLLVILLERINNIKVAWTYPSLTKKRAVHLYLLNAFQYRRASINYLLVNLAVADVLYAVFMVPRIFFQFNFTHPDGGTGTVLCKLLTAGIAAWVGATSSVITLAAIAVERHYAVMYPLGNRGNLTKGKLKVGHIK